MEIIQLNENNIADEHICCAISDKKCQTGYQAKKDWLKQQFQEGYVFKRYDVRGKVFIEYVPAEKGWVPITAPNYLLINCFWVSGKYKKQGYGKQLLQEALNDAQAQNKAGLVTVVGTKKFHFMSDTKWLLKQGFETCATTPAGFSLLVKKLDPSAPDPTFNTAALEGTCPDKEGLVAYYSNRCPFTEYHMHVSLKEAAEKRNLPLTIHKIETLEQAKQSPTPATIFSLFYKGQFITTDLSVCMDSRFDKVAGKYIMSTH
ncbi:MAG: GNAT family N-acetyltransferase [Thermonemataceae bacterium]